MEVEREMEMEMEMEVGVRRSSGGVGSYEGVSGLCARLEDKPVNGRECNPPCVGSERRQRCEAKGAFEPLMR